MKIKHLFRKEKTDHLMSLIDEGIRTRLRRRKISMICCFMEDVYFELLHGKFCKSSDNVPVL
uniref:SFRICE_033118 n=1 Tax=Spodoptera frugiperda TaxID=7108 RepID=A0A2H1VVP1_SPOFR